MVFGLVPRGRLKLQNDTRREMTRKEITFGPLDLKLLRALRRYFQITRIFIVEIIGFAYIIFYKKLMVISLKLVSYRFLVFNPYRR